MQAEKSNSNRNNSTDAANNDSYCLVSGCIASSLPKKMFKITEVGEIPDQSTTTIQGIYTPQA